MTPRRSAALILASVLAVSGLANGAAQASARAFGDCTAMHRVYAAGVAKSTTAAAHPIPSWAKIKAPVVDAATYAANKKLDRDNDGIACEVGR
jgi:hypothetical protein